MVKGITSAYLDEGRGDSLEVACERAIMSSPGQCGGRRVLQAEEEIGARVCCMAVPRCRGVLGLLKCVVYRNLGVGAGGVKARQVNQRGHWCQNKESYPYRF